MIRLTGFVLMIAMSLVWCFTYKDFAELSAIPREPKEYPVWKFLIDMLCTLGFTFFMFGGHYLAYCLMFVAKNK